MPFVGAFLSITPSPLRGEVLGGGRSSDPDPQPLPRKGEGVRGAVHAPPSLVVTAVEEAAAGLASFAPLAAFASLAASSSNRLAQDAVFHHFQTDIVVYFRMVISSSFSLTETTVP